MAYSVLEEINKVSKWIEYEGKKILFHDFTGSDADEGLKYVNEVTKIYKSIESGSKILICYNATDVQMNNKIARALNENTKSCDHIQIKTTVFGISSIQRVIAKVANPALFFGNSEEDCFNWLIVQSFE